MDVSSLLQLYTLLSSPLALIVISIGILLLVREIILWYWRINRIVYLQQKQIELMESILEKISK